MTHTLMYHKPRKAIKRVSTKKLLVLGSGHSVTKIPTKKLPGPRNKHESRSQLVKRLDSVFSQYIRQKYATDGLTACVTCGVVKRWQEQQNGHYMSRGYLPTRWSEDNCAPQCYACNVLRKGHYVEYSLWMINTYGVEKLEELKQRANSGINVTTVEIREMIEKYTNLVKLYLT